MAENERGFHASAPRKKYSDITGTTTLDIATEKTDNRVFIMQLRLSDIRAEMKGVALKMNAFLENQSRFFWVTIGIALLCLVGIIDYWTGFEVSLSLFYLIPIALVTWFAGARLGMVFAISGAIVWLMADILSGTAHSSPFIYLWNSAIRLGFFALTVASLKLIKTLEQEKNIARIDYVTGLPNRRYFHDLAQREINRSFRSHNPFTTAYIDLDNFKAVNDSYGHVMGDKVLRVVADCMQRHLRKTDIVARIGGDEFAIFLPEIGSTLANAVISKMHNKLLEEMQNNNWPVTFSIGVLTFVKSPLTVSEALHMVDQMMYSVKNKGKNNITFATHPSQVAPAAKEFGRFGL
ncbi:MAG TPA: GGDEF domain-containing protein [Burkholderiales bacterium]|nr:GGDEF domain-containing protein [Burkholderiales bacterium]